MGLLTQFSLLLWKNFTLRKRQKVRLVIELVWPLFLFFILVAVRSTTKPVYKDQCHYPNKAMPSAGMLPWLQGMICNIDNPCLNHPPPGETPGQIAEPNLEIHWTMAEFAQMAINSSVNRKTLEGNKDSAQSPQRKR
uniref:ATP-binding cassette, sub-family A (ABC1), member 1B n=1 Tax=Cyprinodon variegatus TaxID=28743 RepID=A0A3Q2CBJ7_CYPVA